MFLCLLVYIWIVVWDDEWTTYVHGRELVSVGICTKWWKHPTTAINLPMTAPFPPDLGSSRVRCDIITIRALEPKPISTHYRYRSIRWHDGEKRQHTAVFGAITRSHFYQRLVRRWCTLPPAKCGSYDDFYLPMSRHSRRLVRSYHDRQYAAVSAASGTTNVSSASTLSHTEWVGKWHN